MSRCRFNAARGSGEQSMDPRFDCANKATRHVLIAVGHVQACAPAGADPARPYAVLVCDEHAPRHDHGIAMTHAVGPACVVEGTWHMVTNHCEPRLQDA